jgi:signal transduction histidine kinase
MKKIFAAVLAGIFLVTGLCIAAADRGTPQEAQALVKKAVPFLDQNGKDKAFAAFNDPKGNFVDRDLYIFVLDLNGAVLSHGANAKLIGKNLMGLKDVDGKLFIADLVKDAKAKDNGWIEYKWENPVNKKVETKTVYYEKKGDLIVASGAYK